MPAVHPEFFRRSVLHCCCEVLMCFFNLRNLRRDTLPRIRRRFETEAMQIALSGTEALRYLLSAEDEGIISHRMARS